MSEDIFSLRVGEVKVNWPAKLSDLSAWFALLVRKLARLKVKEKPE